MKNRSLHTLLSRGLCALMLLTCIASAWAQTSFKLLPPGTQIEGRKFSVTFRAEGGQAEGLKAPSINGCRLVYGPSVSSMSSMTYVNGQSHYTSYVDYTFTYQAEKSGSTSVPAVNVTIGGKTLSSSAASFQILPPDSPQAQRPGAQRGPAQGMAPATPSTPGNRQEPEVQAPPIDSKDLLVRVTFSKTKVYEQEPVIAEIKVYTRHSITNFQVLTQPVFNGFLSEELDVPMKAQIEHYQGQNYYTAVLKRCILYPQKAGRLTINPGKYEVAIQQAVQVPYNYYFSATKLIDRKVNTTSNEVSLNVEALPEPKPAGFNGAVGNFSLTTNLTPEHLRTNEAANLHVDITGTGNIKYLKSPDLTLPVGFDRYTPKTTVDSRVNGNNITGTFSIDYPMMATQVGDYTVGPVEFVYFDPSAGQYRTLRGDTYHVDVARGESSPTGTPTQVAPSVMTDIRHIHRSDNIGGYSEPVMLRTFYWLILAAMLVAFVVILIVYRRQAKLKADVAGRRMARANRVANRRLRAARKVLSQPGDAFYQEISKALYGFFGDKLGMPPSQLMRANIAQELRAYGASQETIDGAIDVLDQCEMARFTPEDALIPREEFYAKAADVIKSLLK